MADRTVNKIYVTKGADRLAVPITDAITLPIGTLVQYETGFANHHDGTGAFAGIVLGGENTNSDGEPVGQTSLTPDPAVYLDTSGVTIVGIPVASATVAGVEVYSNDSDLDNATITQPTTDYPIGIIVAFRSATDCDVQLYTPKEHTLGVQGGGAAWS